MGWMRLLALFMIATTGCNQTTDPIRPSETPFHRDGCSCFPDLDDGACCVEHDRVYWRGGSPDQRHAAGEALQRCLAAKGHPVLARVMYRGVRIGGHGWLPTPYRWGSATAGPMAIFKYHFREPVYTVTVWPGSIRAVVSTGWAPCAGGELQPSPNTGRGHTYEAVSKGGSSVKVKAGDHFDRRHTYSMSRIER